MHIIYSSTTADKTKWGEPANFQSHPITKSQYRFRERETSPTCPDLLSVQTNIAEREKGGLDESIIKCLIPSRRWKRTRHTQRLQMTMIIPPAFPLKGCSTILIAFRRKWIHGNDEIRWKECDTDTRQTRRKRVWHWPSQLEKGSYRQWSSTVSIRFILYLFPELVRRYSTFRRQTSNNILDWISKDDILLKSLLPFFVERPSTEPSQFQMTLH